MENKIIVTTKYIEANATKALKEILLKLSFDNQIEFDGAFASELSTRNDYNGCFVGFNRTDIYIITIHDTFEIMDILSIPKHKISNVKIKKILFSKDFRIIIECGDGKKYKLIALPNLKYIPNQNVSIERILSYYSVKQQ